MLFRSLGILSLQGMSEVRALCLDTIELDAIDVREFEDSGAYNAIRGLGWALQFLRLPSIHHLLPLLTQISHEDSSSEAETLLLPSLRQLGLVKLGIEDIHNFNDLLRVRMEHGAKFEALYLPHSDDMEFWRIILTITAGLAENFIHP